MEATDERSCAGLNVLDMSSASPGPTAPPCSDSTTIPTRHGDSVREERRHLVTLPLFSRGCRASLIHAM